MMSFYLSQAPDSNGVLGLDEMQCVKSNDIHSINLLKHSMTISPFAVSKTMWYFVDVTRG